MREEDYEFEVWQGDEMVASAIGTRDDALREAMHYVAQYEQDGPVRVFEVTRTLVLTSRRTSEFMGATRLHRGASPGMIGSASCWRRLLREIAMSERKDLCLNCGAEHASQLWGADCACGAENVVHQQACNGCGRIVGQITDDDYCGPEKLYCPDCMDKARNKTPNERGQGRDACGASAAPMGCASNGDTEDE